MEADEEEVTLRLFCNDAVVVFHCTALLFWTTSQAISVIPNMVLFLFYFIPLDNASKLNTDPMSCASFLPVRPSLCQNSSAIVSSRWRSNHSHPSLGVRSLASWLPKGNSIKERQALRKMNEKRRLIVIGSWKLGSRKERAPKENHLIEQPATGRSNGNIGSNKKEWVLSISRQSNCPREQRKIAPLQQHLQHTPGRHHQGLCCYTISAVHDT